MFKLRLNFLLRWIVFIFRPIDTITSISNGNLNQMNNDDRLLSVSGKKKCSHCGYELGI